MYDNVGVVNNLCGPIFAVRRRTNPQAWRGRGQGRRRRSSRPLTPASPRPSWSMERSGAYFGGASFHGCRVLFFLPKPPSLGASRTNHPRRSPNSGAPSTMYSVRYYSMIACSNSLPSLEGRWGVQSGRRLRCRATGLNGLPRVRTALLHLLVVLPGAQHPVQPDRQFMGDRDLGNAMMLVERQT